MVIPAKPGFGLFGNSRRIQEALEQMQADMDAISQGKLPDAGQTADGAD